MSDRTLVPGEDLPTLVPFALTAIGLACAAGTVLAWSAAAKADVSMQSTSIATGAAPPPPAASALVASVAPKASAQPEATAPPSASTAPKPSGCPPMIVVFENGIAHAPRSADAPLAALGQWLAAHPTITVTVDGHADANGSEDDNLRLSRQRAAAAAAALVAGGATSSKITVRGFGAFSPVDEVAPDAADNRRVVIQTKGDSCPREQEEVVVP